MGILPEAEGGVSKVVNEVRRFAARHPLTGPGVVAVSGGADSVALLRGLHEAELGPLTVAHLNHLLRGEESDADERFVAELAGSLGLPARTQRVDVNVAADRERGNVEAVARRLRYEWLTQVAHHVGANWVATGHTADDQAETVLHRLIRGTGIQGLRGIAAVREYANPGLRVTERCLVVRPFLTVFRADVLAYLASREQPHREDTTNADVHLTRNRIRHELLPLLRTYNPAISDILGRLAGHADEVFTLQEQQAIVWLRACELPQAGRTIVFDGVVTQGMQDGILREVVRLVWRREAWPTRSMTFEHWDRAVQVVRGTVPAADFPGGIHIRHAGRVVQLGRRT